jgi:hypothetical protein
MRSRNIGFRGHGHSRARIWSVERSSLRNQTLGRWGQHDRRFGDGDLTGRRAALPFASGKFLDYLEAGEDKHRELIEAMKHRDISRNSTEQTTECGR